MGQEARDLEQGEGTTTSTTPGGSGGATLMSRIQEMFFNPHQTWPSIKAETLSIAEIYTKYLLILAAIPVVSTFLSMVTVGRSMFGVTVKWSFMQGIVTSVFQYGLSLAFFFIGAFIIEKLAERFEGQCTRENALKLITFSAMPVAVAGLLNLIPMLSIFTIFFGIYGLYIMFKAIPLMTGVAKERTLGFFAATTVSMLIAGIVLSFVVTAIAPGAARAPSFSTSGQTMKLPGGVSIDMDEAQRAAERFQKMFPAEGQ